jgi:hypothetical protein
MLGAETLNKNDIMRKIEAPLQASTEVFLEVSAEKTKHMVMSLHRNIKQNHNVTIVNKSFEKVVKFSYLGTTTCCFVWVRNLVSHTKRGCLRTGY